MLTIEEARALQLEAELCGDELVFDEGVPLVSPSPTVAAQPLGRPPAPRPRATLDSLNLQGRSPVALATAQLAEIKKLETPEEFFTALEGFALYAKDDGSPATILPGAGPHSARLFLLAGRFQEEDFAQKAPLSGKSGAILDELFRASSLSLNLCWKSAIYKSRAPLGRPMLPREKNLFRDIVRKELELVAPARILVLGAPALELLLGKKVPLEEVRNEEFDGIPLDAIPHPLQLENDPAAREETLRLLQALEKKLHS